MQTKKDEDFKPSRKMAQMVTFAQIQELLQRNVTRSVSRTYTQYQKDSVKTYLASPGTNLDNIREVSRYLERNSMLYKIMLLYYASAPLFNYNLTQTNDWSKRVNSNKNLKSYLEVAEKINGFNIKKEMFNAIYGAVRDGMYVGFVYETDNNTFIMPLDVKYCRIYGKNSAGQWVVYFDASYFTSGSNSIFVEGLNGDTSGCWDDCFIEGYNNYQTDRQNAQWFRLPPEKTFCLLSCSDDEFDVPIPFLSALFISLMDLQDMEQIIADKTELENYKLLVNKIPLFSNSQELNDWMVDLELAQKFDKQFDNELPQLVGHVLSPGLDLDVVSFEKSNSAEDTTSLADSMQNLFNNAGVSQIVVAGGSSTNNIGVKHSIENNMSTVWTMVNRIESWLNYYISVNISEGYVLQIHTQYWYNRNDYINEKKDAATLGCGAMDYLTAQGDTPYVAYQKIQFDNMLGIKDLMKPLSSSYTQSSSDGSEGAPKKDETELTDEGLDTRASDKNGTENE